MLHRLNFLDMINRSITIFQQNLKKRGLRILNNYFDQLQFHIDTGICFLNFHISKRIQVNESAENKKTV